MALYGTPDGWDEDPETIARRDANREQDRREAAYQEAQRRGRWIGPDGMSVDAHLHDAPPSSPEPEPFHPEDDPTGRHRYQASTSPTVMLPLVCTAPGCTVVLTLWGRTETVEAARKAGGPRCPAHPLNTPASQAATQAEGGT